MTGVEVLTGGSDGFQVFPVPGVVVEVGVNRTNVPGVKMNVG
jgi:hypothetical protein